MKKSLIFSLVSGVVIIFAFPDFGLWPLAWVAFVPLFLALDPKRGGITPRRGFFLGWVFGFVFFLGTVYWVVHSMYFFGGLSLATSIVIMLLMVCYLALWFALFSLCFVFTRGFSTLARLFLIPCLWVAFEYLRTHLILGFPWALIGYSQAGFLTLIQISDITGVWGVSFLVMTVNTLIFLCFAEPSPQKFASAGRLGGLFRARGLFEGRAFRPPVIETVITVLFCISVLVYGAARTGRVDAMTGSWPVLKVGIAQGNFEQDVKWNPTNRKSTIDTYTALTAEAVAQGAELVVWPETAVPFYLEEDRQLGPLVLNLPDETGSYILTGSPSYSYNKKLGAREYFNSAYLIKPGGFTERYDKFYLVPFGEYVPLKRFLFFAEKLVEGSGDFSPGRGAYPLLFNGRSIGVLICYEAIFPEISRSFVKGGATLLANLTNDSWFGDTSAPHQHLGMSIFRAVENRVFLVRSANTGISAIVDPVGRIRQRSSLFTETFLAGEVGLRFAPPGVYTRYGDFFPFILMAVSVVFLAQGVRRRLRDVRGD
jgi:apolipoprotein N-acyltransferase